MNVERVCKRFTPRILYYYIVIKYSCLRRCDTCVNGSVDKSLFEALASSSGKLCFYRQKWSGNRTAWSNAVFLNAHGNVVYLLSYKRDAFH